MSKIIIHNNEQVYLEGSVTFLKTSYNVNQGTAYITSERFVFCKRSGLSNALLGPIFMHFSKGKTIVFEIKLNEIKSIGAIKHGLTKKYILKSKNGNEYALQFVKNKEKWLKTIQDAILNHKTDTKVKVVGDLIEFS